MSGESREIHMVILKGGQGLEFTSVAGEVVRLKTIEELFEIGERNLGLDVVRAHVIEIWMSREELASGDKCLLWDREVAV